MTSPPSTRACTTPPRPTGPSSASVVRCAHSTSASFCSSPCWRFSRAAGSPSTPPSRSPAPWSRSPTPWRRSPPATMPDVSSNQPPRSSANSSTASIRWRPISSPPAPPRRLRPPSSRRSTPPCSAAASNSRPSSKPSPPGVVTLSPDRRIVLVNRTFSEMLDPGGERSLVGSTLEGAAPL